MGLWHRLAQQFRQPTGFLGRLAGFFFRINLEGIEWTINLLRIQPTDHVLEIGFGPGHGIQHAAKIAAQGRVAGVDFSETMLQAGVSTQRRGDCSRPGRTVSRRCLRPPVSGEYLP